MNTRPAYQAVCLFTSNLLLHLPPSSYTAWRYEVQGCEQTAVKVYTVACFRLLTWTGKHMHALCCILLAVTSQFYTRILRKNKFIRL